MDSSTKPAVIDLFCGAGGLSSGFRQAGFDILAGIDLDHDSIETFRYNHPRARGIEANIQDLTNEEILKIVGDRAVDVVIGSPPCQGFTNIALPKLRSLGHPHKVNTARNRLYKEFIRVVKLLQPKFFLMENVRGMMTIENGKIKRDLFARLGDQYAISLLYLDAASYGVPQHRKRIFVIANRIGHENPYPAPSHIKLDTSVQSKKLKPFVTVREAISDLPVLKPGKGSNEMRYRTKPRSEYQISRRKNRQTVFNHFARTHCEQHLSLFKMLRQGRWSTQLPANLHPYRSDIFHDRIKRQRWNAPSTTIIAHIHKDGLMFIHPFQNRTFTPREAARLQSFDDGYFFVGRQTSIFKQIGNAVPPLMARAIARAIFRQLAIAEVVPFCSHK